MATKTSSKSSGLQTRHVLGVLFLALGIYLVIAGVLSDVSETWRSVLIATGLATNAGATIGLSKRR